MEEEEDAMVGEGSDGELGRGGLGSGVAMDGGSVELEGEVRGDGL